VVAKASNPNLTRDQARVLLQKLLADRFQLKVERSTKELDQYSLLVGKKATPKGQGGSLQVHAPMVAGRSQSAAATWSGWSTLSPT
jgi:uncharacterized protein (TIGR03435 family)